jgi:3-hydroxybutyryl-CoA dehydrogenase
MALTLEGIHTVAVLGAGTMGRGIAQLAAQAGWAVRLYDVELALAEKGLAQVKVALDRAVEKGKLSAAARDEALGRIRPVADLADTAGAELAIEAVPEKLELKQRLLSDLGARLGPTALLASNTSSLSLTAIARGVPQPERVVGMHFFNPPPVMKLLEVVRAEQSSPATVALARAVGEKLGKEVIEVRDAPGFASSRLGICLGMEAIRMLEQEVASAADIDQALRLGYGHPMGPLELTDLVGLDVRMAIGEHLARELAAPQFQPPALLRRLVGEGKLGKKSGQGFYRYGPDGTKT